jgi:hypothetical protein
MPSEEQLANLAPEHAEYIRSYEQVYGPGSADAIYENIVGMGPQTGTPLPASDPADLTLLQREPVSQASMSNAWQAAYNQAYRDALGEGVSDAEAKKQALAAVRAVTEAPRTSRGKRIEAPAPGVLETAPLSEAFVAALMPQPLMSPQEAEGMKEARALRDKEIQKEENALRAIAKQQAGVALRENPGQDRQAVYRNYYEQAARDLLVTKRQHFRAEARRLYFNQPGVEPVSPRATEKKREQDEEIRDLADEMYLDWRDLAFKDVDIPGEDKPQRSMSSYAKQLARWATVNETSEGIPYETPLAAGMRDLGALVRPITKTAIDAISFEVDEQGNPIDTEDINYKLYQIQEKALQGLQSGEKSLSNYAAALSGFAPTAMAATRTHGPRGEANTGSWQRDLIISMAQGNFLGDDYANLQAAKNFYQGTGYEWVPWVSGLSMELLLPITPYPVLKPGVKGALRAGGSVADAADLPQVAKAFNTMAEPVKAASEQILKREVEAVSKGLGLEARAALVLEEATVPSQVAEMMAGDVASAIRAGKGAKFPTDSLAGKMIGELETINEMAARVAKTSDKVAKGAKDTDRVLRFGDTLLGKEIIQQVRKAEVIGVAADDIAEEVVKTLAKGRLKEHFANVLPNDWVRVAPYVIVTKKAVAEVGDAVNSRVKEITKTARVGDGRRFLRPKQVMAAMRREMPAATIGKNSRIFRIYQDLKKAKPLSQEDYAWVHGIVAADTWMQAIKSSVRLRYTGAAAERSLEPVQRRLTVFRNMGTLRRGVQALLNEGFPPPAKNIKTTGRTSIELDTWIRELQEMVVELPAEFTRKLIKYGEEADSPEQAWNMLMQDLLSEDLALTRRIAKETNTPLPPLEDAADALASIVKNFFGEDVFNIEINAPSTFPRMLREAGIDTLDAENVLKAIEFARGMNSELVGRGLGKRTLRGGGVDEPMAAAAVWAMDKFRKTKLGEAEQKLAQTYPELLIGFGRSVGEQGKVSEAIVAEGVSESVADAISKHAASLTPANRKEVAEQALGEIVKEGTVNGQSVQARLYESITNQDRVTKVILRSDNILSEIDKMLEARGLSKGSDGFEAARTQYAQQVSEAVFQSLTSMNVDRYMGMLGSIGISVTGKKQFDYSVFPSLVGMSGGRGIFLTPQSKGLYESVKKATFSGKLREGLEALNLRDKPLDEAISGYLWLAIDTIRRGTISGFLGGVPLANMRFIGQNNVTAPLIVAITSPSYVWAAVKAIPDAWVGRLASVAEEADVPGARKLSTYLQQRYWADPGDVVIVTKAGRKYTRDEVSKLMDKHNIRFSQVTFQLGDNVVKDVYRAAKMGPDFMPVSARRSALRWLDPFHKNIWNRWTEEADMAFREAVFREALSRGETPEISAKLARNALLDYGAIDPKTRKNVGQFVLFYAFQMMNIVEIAKAFVRDPGAVRNLRRMVVTSHHQQKASGTWLYEDDYQRSRLWGFYGEEWDRVWTGHFGPQVPAIEGFGTLVNAMAIVFGSGYGDAVLAEYLADDFIQHPVLAYYKDKKELLERREGPGPVFDARYVQFLKSVGLWEISQDWFNIKAVPSRKKMKPGEPTFDEDGVPTQYHIENKRGLLKWHFFKAVAISIGIDRNIRDYTTKMIKAGIIAEDVEMKRHGDGSWWAYASNLSTPMKVTGELQALVQMDYAMQQELKAMGQ